MRVRIKPSRLAGIITPPASKSLAHRAIIAASLARGESIISNLTYSNDINMTIRAMEALGASIKRDKDKLIINGSEVIRKNNVIDCGESGSTIRFIIPIAMIAHEPIEFIGAMGLAKRPLEPYLDIFKDFNIEYSKGKLSLPLKVNGGLKPGVYKLCGNISSQFITGLLFALPLLNGDSRIIITTKLESRGYIDLTLDILNKFGISVINNNYEEFIIRGNQEYKSRSYTVEGDFSQAAFYLGMDMLGAKIKLSGMNMNSLQGDKKILDILKSLGGVYKYENSLLELECKEYKYNEISLRDCPDLGPLLATLGALFKDGIRLIDAERLRLKESDRISSMHLELKKINAKINEENDSLEVFGGNTIPAAVFSSHNDHRVVMALAIISLVSKNDIVIDDYEAINKSYPDFFNDFRRLGGKIFYE